MGLLTKCGPTTKNLDIKRNTLFDGIPVKWFHKRSFWQVMFGNSSSKAHSKSADPPNATATSNHYKFDFYLKQLPWKIALGDLPCHPGAISASLQLHLYEGIYYKVGNMKAHSKSCTPSQRNCHLVQWLSKSGYCTIGRAIQVNAKLECAISAM